MSKLYNPELVPKEEIKRTFVGRHKLIEEIISIIEKQPEGAGVQHLIIVAPRGMGKTTLLLMLRFAIEDGDLSKRWQPIQFPEESYDIYELSDFWIKVAEYLAEETGDENLSKKIAEIKTKFTKNEDLYEVAFALLKDWRREHNKQFVLLIDNFDMILEQINSELDAARLRKELMNDDTVMLIGSAVTFFQEIRGYEHPLYNFFKIYNLEGFKTELIEEFLKRRAEEEGLKNFEGILRKNRAKIKTLAYFTDGNPRLVLMLFDVITKSKVNDVEKALESLLDEVTPYFKAKIELLPAQQRKILDYIARMSFEKREGVTPTEISAEVRLTPNQTSSQLKRLAEDGYVKAANISGRSSFYLLSEPLVAIWYQMRFGRTAYQKRRWLIFVLKGLYELEELRKEQTKLRREYKKSLDSGQTDKARDILKHQLYLAEAMPEFSGAKVHFEHFVSQSLILKNESTLKEELRNPDLLKRLSPKLLDNLQKEGLITENQCSKAKADVTARELSKKENDSFAELFSGQKILQELSPEHRQKQLEKALKHFDRAIKLNPSNLFALDSRSSFFYQFGKFREAITDLDKMVSIYEELINHKGRNELINDLAGAYMNKGVVLDSLGRLNEAIEEYDKSIAIFEKLVETGRAELSNDLAMAYLNKGVTLYNLGKLNEAVEEYDKAIKLFDESKEINQNWEIPINRAKAFLNKTEVFINRKEFSKASESLQEAVESLDAVKYEALNSYIFDLIFSTAGDDFSSVRKLLNGKELEKRFFPVLRAIDYLETKDEALIEKLSPEVRGIVEEAVRALRRESAEDSAPDEEIKKRKRK